MRRLLLLTLGLTLPAGCNSGDDGPQQLDDAATDGATQVDAPAIDAPSGTFALTSPTITEGGAIPLTHVCAARGGMNLSPQLAWTGAPAGTLSFAVVLTDKSNNLVHSAIYDIPAALTGLPADVDKVYAPPDVAGAHQSVSYLTGVRGWAGPCPGTVHTYELKLYAVTAATLPGSMMSTSRADVVTALAANNAGTATLTATFTP